MNDFMDLETLATFSGLVAAVTIIIQFAKPLFKGKFSDAIVRVLVLVVSLCMTAVFANSGTGLQGVLLTVINSILVSLTAMGCYEVVADPRAEKSKGDDVDE